MPWRGELGLIPACGRARDAADLGIGGREGGGGRGEGAAFEVAEGRGGDEGVRVRGAQLKRLQLTRVAIIICQGSLYGAGSALTDSPPFTLHPSRPGPAPAPTHRHLKGKIHIRVREGGGRGGLLPEGLEIRDYRIVQRVVRRRVGGIHHV